MIRYNKRKKDAKSNEMNGMTMRPCMRDKWLRCYGKALFPEGPNDSVNNGVEMGAKTGEKGCDGVEMGRNREKVGGKLGATERK